MLVAVVISTTAVFSEVIMRYVFHAPLVGIEEMAAYIAFWMYFIGASYGAYERSHIKAELTHLIFGNTINYARCRAFTSFISFAAALYVIPWAWDYTVWGFVRNEQSRSTLLGSTYPVVYFQISIFIGLILMCFYFLVEFIQWFKIVRSRSEILRKCALQERKLNHGSNYRGFAGNIYNIDIHRSTHTIWISCLYNFFKHNKRN